MKLAIILLLGLSALCANNLVSAQSQFSGPAASDPGWPRQKTTDQGSLVYYQPQVMTGRNSNNSISEWLSLTPKGQKEVVGVLSLQAQTAVDVDQHHVVLTDFKITESISLRLTRKKQVSWNNRSEVSCRRTPSSPCRWTGWSPA